MALPGTEPTKPMRMCCTFTCCGSTSGLTGVVPGAALVSTVFTVPFAAATALVLVFFALFLVEACLPSGLAAGDSFDSGFAGALESAGAQAQGCAGGAGVESAGAAPGGGTAGASGARGGGASPRGGGGAARASRLGECVR